MVGIYCYTNVLNDKKYVGQSLNIANRIENHKYRYNNPNDAGYSQPFHRALREFGYDNFTVEILEECEKEKLLERETFWIDKLQSLYPNGYNIFAPDKTDVNYHHLRPLAPKPEQTYRGGKLNDNLYLEIVSQILFTSMRAVAISFGYSDSSGLKKWFKAFGYPVSKKDMELYFFQKTGHHHQTVVDEMTIQTMKQLNREKHQPKPIGMYTLEGQLIATYPSLSAAEKEGFRTGPVSECCQGKRKRAYGKMFKYL